MSVWQKLDRCYPVWWEWAVLALIVFSFWYPAVHYAELPARFPTHFGPSGLPDTWGPKNLLNVYLVPLIMAGSYILITALNFWFVSTPDPRKLINLPKKRLEKMSPEQVEIIRQETIKGLFVLKVMLAAESANLSYTSTRVALGLEKGLGFVGTWLFVGAIMIYSLYLTVRILNISK